MNIPPASKGSNKYKHLFFDLDHTLWDFEANARATLATLYEDLQLKARGINDFDLFYRNYLAHNDKLWNDLPKEVQNSVLKAEKELKTGKGIPHEVVMKKYSKWLTK